MWIAGVDGCKAGWFVVRRDCSSGQIVHAVARSLSDVVRTPDSAVIAVDIPIGLLEHAVPRGRECDRQARALLGPVRASSVFTPPVRPALAGRTYRDACAINAASSIDGMKIAQQCYGLFPKLCEVDAFMTPALQEVVREVHPELCFYELNGHAPMTAGKKETAGVDSRRSLLERVGVLNARHVMLGFGGVGIDDVLDAYAALWTAERIVRSEAVCIPAKPLTDGKGLRMEMWR